MRRAFFFIVAVCLATSSFASIPRASILDAAPSIAEPLSETRIRVSEVLAPFERPAESELSRAVRQAYADSSTTNASGLGRFLSPDPVLGNPGQPQSWNRYAYALNNPLRYTDPRGQSIFDIFKLSWWEKKMNEWYPPKQLPQDDPNKQALIEAGYTEEDAERFANPQGAVDKGLNKAQAVIANEATTEAATQVIGAAVGGLVSKALSREAILLRKALASEAQMAESGIRIAGAGTRTTLRDTPRLVAAYGGEAADWVKMRSSS